MRRFALLATAVLALLVDGRQAVPQSASRLYFVDAHSQMDHNVDKERVLSLMDRGGVYRTILSSHLDRPWHDIPAFAEESGGRIVPAVRTKGDVFNPFYRYLKDELSSGRFVAMAEVLVYHDSRGGKFPDIRLQLNDPRVVEAFDAARNASWPFIIHLEFAMMSRAERARCMSDLESFLDRHPNDPLVLIHKAFLAADEIERLIVRYPNVYFTTSTSFGGYEDVRNYPELNILGPATKEPRLSPRWKRLFVAHSDRFVFSMDNVFSAHWIPRKYLGEMTIWWRIMADLPDEVAHAVAHGNAERLWRLAPKPPEAVVVPPWEAESRLGPVKGYSANRLNK